MAFFLLFSETRVFSLAIIHPPDSLKCLFYRETLADALPLRPPGRLRPRVPCALTEYSPLSSTSRQAPGFATRTFKPSVVLAHWAASHGGWNPLLGRHTLQNPDTQPRPQRHPLWGGLGQETLQLPTPPNISCADSTHPESSLKTPGGQQLDGGRHVC